MRRLWTHSYNLVIALRTDTVLSAWRLVQRNPFGGDVLLEPAHAATTDGIIPCKVGMTISPFVGTFDDTIKAIMIQLTLKASIFGLREVARQDCFYKQGLLVHAKALTVGAPGDYGRVVFSFYVHEHFMEFDGKCHITS